MTFEGFVPPTKNYFPMPNEWTNISAKIDSLAELKVIEYVLRHTWGFQEYGILKTISIDEFMHGRRRQDQSRIDEGTGLSEQGVRNGLKQAIEDGYLIFDVDPSDAGRIKKSYALKMQVQVQAFDPPQTFDPSTGTKFVPQGTKSLTSGPQTFDPRVLNSIPRTEKDTLETHLEKDTLETQGYRAQLSEAKEVIDETLLEVKTASGKHKAVSSHSHAAIGSDEDISLAETAHRMPAVKIGATNANSHLHPGDNIATTGNNRIHPLQDLRGTEEDEQQKITSELVSSQDGAASAATPPGGVISATSSGPRASGFVVSARPKPPVQSRMREPKPPTEKDLKRQNETRAREIWVLIEQKLETTFSASQRRTDKNKRGMERLLEDQVSDEKIELALSRLTEWEVNNFDLQRFHELLPGKTAKHRAGANNNMSPAKQGDQEYGVSGLPKLKPLGSVK